MEVPTPIQQSTDRGINNLSISETTNTQNAPLFPALPPLVHWDRWYLRWVGFFCVGAAFPSVLAILPAVWSIALLVILLLGAIVLGGWGNFRRENTVPAAVVVFVFLTGILFSLLTLAYRTYAEPKPNPSPLQANSLNI